MEEDQRPGMELNVRFCGAWVRKFVRKFPGVSLFFSSFFFFSQFTIVVGVRIVGMNF